MVSRQWPRPLLAVAAALAAALSVAGCVSIPSAGPVQTYPVTQGTDATAQPYPQVYSGPPQPGWTPKAIVAGFLTASASVGNEQVAREYLTTQASKDWNPATWSAIVYKSEPEEVSLTSNPPAPKPTVKASGTPTAKAAAPPQTATVTINGQIEATLSGNGSYAVADTSNELSNLPTFELVKVGGQWRISVPPTELLLTASSFTNDYQLRNLYFFDPQIRYLVPDPVYVPLQATPAELMDGLVRELIRQPADWLANDATTTAFPPGTTLLGDVTVDGVTAEVNLGGGAIARAPDSVMERVSGQLLRTLSGTGQGGQAVQCITVLQDGKAWMPHDSQDNPVQCTSGYNPAYGASGTFYYLSGGVVFSQAGANAKPAVVERIGIGYSQIAVSPDGKYLAAVTSGGDLYTGRIGQPLTKRSGTEYTSVSWAPNDDLYATENSQIVVLLPGNRLVPVNQADGVTALAVAPDGVRVAVIFGNELLEFGAISWQRKHHGPLSAYINFNPFYVESVASLQAVTWYGSDDVIALANPGPSPSVTEYPVNGGTTTPISAVPGMTSISASYGSALIAGLPHGHMEVDASLTGSWVPLLGGGTSPVYPG
jgi:WD40 repeat protein